MLLQVLGTAAGGVRPQCWIRRDSKAFSAYRGESWMQEPCRGCELRAQDFGGCRCQAYALTGDATRTDPVCSPAPGHALVRDLVDRTHPPESAVAPAYVYRAEQPTSTASAHIPS
ncbi:hypothetical protein ACFWU3_09820 [Streptomyces sp. NPDC058685]|uniref:hypothetical protein n=1 Tax=Streptomyces sp. NPDC058685 TaxID=3346598 RepID=UPI0036594DDC